MLNIFIPPTEMWDEVREEFVTDTNGITLQLEHSLLSISKWEARWKKPYYGKEEKTQEELKDYIRCMSVKPVADPQVFSRLTRKDIDQIVTYINDPMTATTFRDDKQKKKQRSREQTTSELIYYWMAQYGIPFDCEKWHINRLLTLIRVCHVKSSPSKKKSNDQLLREYSSINERNKKLFNTRG